MLDLGAKEGWPLHLLRNVLIIATSLALLPASAMITLVALSLQLARIIHAPRRRAYKDGKPPPRILVTGVGMAKGLFLCRTMYVGGCEVFAGDFDNGHGNLHCGRFSGAVRRFFALKSPAVWGPDAYISQVVGIVVSQRIDLWISCSGVATAVEDARLARAIEQRANNSCKVFQLSEDMVSTLDDKLGFMRKTSELKLDHNLQWYPLERAGDVAGVLGAMDKSASKGECAAAAAASHDSRRQHVEFMVKSASMDDLTRGALPLVGAQNMQQAGQILGSLDFGNGRRWVLQEFIRSDDEYCTQAVVVDGRVRAFAACPSASVLMHYRPLPPEAQSSLLYAELLRFTRDYVAGLGGGVTGHLSFDFLVRWRDAEDGFVGSVAPIECNPRCHTAAVLFEGLEHELAGRYLEALGVGGAGSSASPEILQVGGGQGDGGFYWMAHDVVVCGLGAFCDLATTARGSSRCLQSMLGCVTRLLTWRDPTFRWWDPMPWFVLNHVYWPWELAVASWHGVKWKQLNVSTAKMFKV